MINKKFPNYDKTPVRVKIVSFFAGINRAERRKQAWRDAHAKQITLKQEQFNNQEHNRKMRLQWNNEKIMRAVTRRIERNKQKAAGRTSYFEYSIN